MISVNKSKKTGRVSVSKKDTNNTIRALDINELPSQFSTDFKKFKDSKGTHTVIYTTDDNEYYFDYTQSTSRSWSGYPSRYRFVGFFERIKEPSVMSREIGQHNNTNRKEFSMQLNNAISASVSIHGQLGNCGSLTLFNLTQNLIENATEQQIDKLLNGLASAILQEMIDYKLSLLVITDGNGAYFTSGGVPRDCQLNCTSIGQRVAKLARGKFKKVFKGTNPKTGNPQFLSYAYIGA